MSARKDKGVWLIIASVLLVVVVTFIYVILPNLPQSNTNLHLGDGIFQATTATTYKDRTKGLSRVTEMAPNQALLMAFPTDGKWGIWMKDMKISIDIVWLNSDKKVVYIVKNALPDDSTSVVFSPKTDTRYVVELSAGTVDSKAINIGDIAVFQIDSARVK